MQLNIKDSLKKIGLKKTDPEKIKAGVLVLFVLIILGTIFYWGITKIPESKEAYSQAVSEADANMKKAAALPATKQQLKSAVRKWSTSKERLALYSEGGLFFELLNDLAVENGIQDIDITHRGTEYRFFDDHLRAICYDVTIKGHFPGIYGILNGIENSRLTAEIKPICIELEGDIVTANATVILCSLNPPCWYDYVMGESGRYDPFFNPEIRMMEILKEMESDNTNKEGGEENKESEEKPISS